MLIFALFLVWRRNSKLWRDWCPADASWPRGGPRPSASQDLGQVCQGCTQLRREENLNADGPIEEPDQAGADVSTTAPGGDISSISKHLLFGAGPGPRELCTDAGLLWTPSGMQGTMYICKGCIKFHTTLYCSPHPFFKSWFSSPKFHPLPLFLTWYSSQQPQYYRKDLSTFPI